MSGLVLYLSLFSGILALRVSNFVSLALGDKQKLCLFLFSRSSLLSGGKRAWILTQPLDLCPELAMPPGGEGQLNICSPLCSFLLSGILASLALVALSALSDVFKQFKNIYYLGVAGWLSQRSM